MITCFTRVKRSKSRVYNRLTYYNKCKVVKMCTLTSLLNTASIKVLQGTVPCNRWCIAEDFNTITCSKEFKKAEVKYIVD